MSDQKPNQTNNLVEEEVVDTNALIAQRRSKLTAMREEGNAFPNDFRRDVMAGELHAEYNEKSNEELEAEPIRVKVAGRMMSQRIMGKASFAHLRDMSGQIQLFVTRDALPEGFTTSNSRSGILVTSSPPKVFCLKLKRVSYR